MKRLLYRFTRFWVKLIVRPSISLSEPLAADGQIVYVLHHRALTDLLILDLVCSENDLQSPLTPITALNVREASSFFPLMRSARGRITMRDSSPRMTRLVAAPTEFQRAAYLVPTTVFWGRAMSGEGTWLRLLTSEHWAATGRFKRLVNILINRRNISVRLGRPILLAEVCQGVDPAIAVRRTARLLRVRLRAQKVRTLGPDFSHRRTLIDQVITSRAVKQAINELAQDSKEVDKLTHQAAKYTRTIASDMSHPTVRVLARLLSWFWNRIYDGIELKGIQQIDELSETHTLLFAPSHRSHLDYLLLSYLLYYRGIVIPHVAAGDNLNIPLLGSILRRGGAFFMRRSFRDDAVYQAVFQEYLYQVYRQGHSVEFFPEGGRTRTGRLLPAKLGFLRMTLTVAERGLPKPLALVPVYFSYEKLVEGASYLAELRGADKQGESITDIFRNLKLVGQDFGTVVVNVAKPILLDQWLSSRAKDEDLTAALASEIMFGINQHAFVNAVNFVALVTLSTPKLAIEEHLLIRQISCYQRLLLHAQEHTAISYCDATPGQIVARTEQLGLLEREAQPYGTVFSHSPYAAVLMTWYRNNVIHTLLIPSLITCLVMRRRRGITKESLSIMVKQIYPYLAQEFTSAESPQTMLGWLDCLVQEGLLHVKEELITTSVDQAQAQIQLNLLANLVMPTLERMFIVLHQLGVRPTTRTNLQSQAQEVAQKISRLYGINAPEFADRALFNLFIDGLIAASVVTLRNDGYLEKTALIDQVLKAASYVIEPQVRHAVVSAISAISAIDDSAIDGSSGNAS